MRFISLILFAIFLTWGLVDCSKNTIDNMFGRQVITITKNELAHCIHFAPIHLNGKPSFEMEFVTAKHHLRLGLVGNLAEEIMKKDVLLRDRGVYPFKLQIPLAIYQER